MARPRQPTPTRDRPSVDVVVGRVLASRRYGSVDEALIRRLALDEIPKARNLADAEKRTKRRLHQIVGAYCSSAGRAGSRLGDGAARLQSVSSDLTDPALRSLCRDLLGQHASTRERVGLLDEYYGRIFAITGLPAVVLDLACGLNPLALPWMGLPADVRYLAFDVDHALIALVDAFLGHVGVAHAATVQDVIVSPPVDRADIAFVLKALPCLEHQQAGAGSRLLHAVDARHIVVSYPTRSLGNRGKGMAQVYRARFHEIVDGAPWAVYEIELANELVFVVEKPARSMPMRRR